MLMQVWRANHSFDHFQHDATPTDDTVTAGRVVTRRSARLSLAMSVWTIHHPTPLQQRVDHPGEQVLHATV